MTARKQPPSLINLQRRITMKSLNTFIAATLIAVIAGTIGMRRFLDV
jgi:hypothetical protein